MAQMRAISGAQLHVVTDPSAMPDCSENPTDLCIEIGGHAQSATRALQEVTARLRGLIISRLVRRNGGQTALHQQQPRNNCNAEGGVVNRIQGGVAMGAPLLAQQAGLMQITDVEHEDLAMLHGSNGLVERTGNYGGFQPQSLDSGIDGLHNEAMLPSLWTNPPEPLEEATCHEQFSVPGDKIGNIIGWKGSKVQLIRSQSGADVKISTSPMGGERIISFRGSRKQVHAAHSLAYTFMTEEGKSAETLTINRYAGGPSSGHITEYGLTGGMGQPFSAIRW